MLIRGRVKECDPCFFIDLLYCPADLRTPLKMISAIIIKILERMHSRPLADGPRKAWPIFRTWTIGGIGLDG